MPIAIEVFEKTGAQPEFRIDINGSPWTTVTPDELPQKLSVIGDAYAAGELQKLFRRKLRHF